MNTSPFNKSFGKVAVPSRQPEVSRKNQMSRTARILDPVPYAICLLFVALTLLAIYVMLTLMPAE